MSSPAPVCRICAGALEAEPAIPSDREWLGRQLERHAGRAVRALERAERAELEREGLAARLEHFEGVASNLARALEQIARAGKVIDGMRDEARELRRRADDAIPFGGPDAVDESAIAAWNDRARLLLELAGRLEEAIGV